MLPLASEVALRGTKMVPVVVVEGSILDLGDRLPGDVDVGPGRYRSPSGRIS